MDVSSGFTYLVNPSRKPRLLLGHSFWGRGGAETAGMWLLQSLSCCYDVDVITRGGWDLGQLNEWAGTSISSACVGNALYPPHGPRVNGPGGAIWDALFVRHCRRLSHSYQLCITVSGTINWGRRALHFLSDVAWNAALRRKFLSGEGIGQTSLPGRVYSFLAAHLEGRAGHDIQRYDTFVANSKWTAELSAPFCVVPPTVIYPAVRSIDGLAHSGKRETSLLYLGRIAREKRIERIIAIADLVRQLGVPIRLHIAGSTDDPEYLQRVHRLCEARSEWIDLHGPVTGRTKADLLNRCQYGINPCEREAFGIATAEMASAGIITFAPRMGAQAEIVQDERLLFDNAADAALKIRAIHTHPQTHAEIQGRLLEHTSNFRPEKFASAVQLLVERLLPPATTQHHML